MVRVGRFRTLINCRYDELVESAERNQEMANKLLSFILVALMFVGFHESAQQAVAQLESETAVEGYVFASDTLRPIPNAVLGVTLHFADGAAATYGAATDANGFYSIQFPGTGEFQNAWVAAGCITKRGIIRSSSALYAPLRPQVYVRNLYLRLPSRTTCSLTPPQSR